MLQKKSSNAGGPSLSRRRGTKGGRGSLRHVALLLVCLIVTLLGVIVTLFVQMSAVEKQTPVDSLRHKVQAVPNLLRGRQFSSRPKASTTLTTTTEEQVVHHNGVGGRAHSDQQEKSNQQTVKNSAVHHIDSHGSSSHSNNANNNAAASTSYPYPLNTVPDDYDIGSQFTPPGGNRFAEYKQGTAPSYEITPELRQLSDDVARSRRPYVRASMQFAWKGYEDHAFGQDEVLPQTGKGSDNWGGQGITLVDSLDTLWLMNLKDEFWRGRDWVRDHLDHGRTGPVSVFETTIRDLGGLLAAYDWSKDRVFLDKALDLGTRLLKAFDGADTGIPFGQVSLRDGHASNIAWAGSNAIFAEFGTIQVENRYLTKLTGQPQFAQKTNHVFDILHEIARPDGLYPYYFRNQRTKGKLQNGDPKPEFANDKITFGAMADSTYEYMLKMWLQGGKTESLYRDMWDKAIDSMHEKLLQYSTPSGLAYIADRNNGRLDHKMDHLVCFMGGALALGAYTDPQGLDSTRAQRDLTTARALTYTCYQMYARMATGISPEFVQFEAGRDFVVGRGAPHYLLRPEAFESFFILNQLTGDPVYREWGWECFQAIEKYCKTNIAYGSLPNVQDTNGKPRNKMESFFLAETLKYLYLLQDPDTEVDILNKHVFNTEAHPLRMFPVIDQDGGK